MTANARTPHPVLINDSNATAGTILYIFNRTTGDTATVKFVTANNTNYDLAELGVYVKTDVIEFSVHGIYEGSATYTVSGGTGIVTITSTASAAPGLTI